MALPHPPLPGTAATGLRDRVVGWLDLGMELGVWLFVFALFNRGTTALSNLGVYVPLGLWLLKHALTRGAQLGYLRTALGAALLAFACWTGASALWSPEPLASLNEWRKTMGWMLASALVVGDLCRDEARSRRLLQVIGWSGVWVVGLDIAQYAGEYLRLGRLPKDIGLHRGFSDPYVYFAPFSLALAALAQERQQGWWLFVFVLQAILVVPTGARSAWLAFALAVALWLSLRFDRRVLRGFGVAVLAVLLATAWVVPEEVVMRRVAAGFDTSKRAEATWGPALAMSGERPLAGFGYGRQVFHDAFGRRRPQHPEWILKQSSGPHSSYLEILFAAGAPGLALLLVLYAALARSLWRLARSPTPAGTLALAALAAFLGQFAVRGVFESIRWDPLGLLLGLALAALAAARRRG